MPKLRVPQSRSSDRTSDPVKRHGRLVVRRYPRVMVAAKAACAASLAWLAVQPVGGFVHQYPYYAPLGAAVAMATTVADSVRLTVQSVLAILTGAALALTAHEAPVGELGGIAVVTGVGTLLAGWPVLGAMGGWVPVSGLFVLIVGGAQPSHYVMAYGGLTGAGAAIGVVVNAAFPQLPLTPATLAQARFRDALARELEAVAEALISEGRLSSDAWADVIGALDPQRRQVDEHLRISHDSRRANWRARRWAEVADRRHAQGRALRRMAGCVEEVVALVSDPDASWHADDPLGATLREAIATALVRTAEMIRAVDEEDPEAGRDERRAAAEAVQELRRTVTELPHRPPEHGLDTAAVVISLERAVGLWQRPA